jgi:HlyD family secretion protein
MRTRSWIGLGVILAAAAGGAYLVLGRRGEPVRWRTAQVDQGPITQRVTATGTVNALIQVPVGTQVSGVVVDLKADFSSLVRKGQVIAQIDPTPWLTSLKGAEAGLRSAEETRANAQIVHQRNKALWEARLISQSDLDTAALNLKVATANLDKARAELESARTNLGYCSIKAPVDGVVVARLVDVGQTVAASFSTPSLFTIAQDLSRMKVSAAIDEADIGQVKVGQPAFFTVESYPDRQFKGVVSEVQLNPVINNNVVTYNVIMEVANEPRAAGAGAPRGQGGDAPRGQGSREPGRGAGQGGPGARMGSLDPERSGALEHTTARYMVPGSPVYSGNLALFPGMTADCAIITQRREAVVRVPSAALRFNPSAFLAPADLPRLMAPGQAPAAGRGQGGAARPAGAGARPGGAAGGGGGVVSRGMVARSQERIWTLEQGKLKAVPVKAGISDGMYTEVGGEGIAPGLVVVTGLDDVRKAQNGSAPLMGGMRH